MQLPQVRTLALSGGQFITGAIAAITFMSSKSVDLYKAWDQLYQGVQMLAGAWALLAPIAIGAYAVYKASTAEKLKDVLQDPSAVDAAKSLPVTPGTVAVAEALKKAP